MADRPRIWGRGTLPFALAAVAVASAWAWWTQPETTQLGFARIPVGARSSVVLDNLSAPSPRNAPCPAWRLHLRIDRGLKPPGPEWMMFEGGKPGDGYELHWAPSRLGLVLVRASDALVLGSKVLGHFPEQVVLVRHGCRLEVWADEQLALTATDPQAAALATSWGFQASGPMDDSSITLIDDRRLLSEAELRALVQEPANLAPLLNDRSRADHALLTARHALALDPERVPGEVTSALERAGSAARSDLNGQEQRARLLHWLSWGETRLALMRQDNDAPIRTRAAIEQLVVLAGQMPVAESAGLIMDLLDRIVRTCSRAPTRIPEEVVRWRHGWLENLAFAATHAESACSPALGDDWRWQLRLVAHAADCLRGKRPRPTPAEAPDWVVSRWRAFAGGNPSVPSFSANIPAPADERNPVRPALDHLIQLAAFEPGGAAAMVLRARILDALEITTPASADPDVRTEARRQAERRALEALRTAMAPAREVALDTLLLALAGVGDPAAVLTANDPRGREVTDGLVPWTRRDPLAYALWRLLRYRSEIRSTGNPFKSEELPEQIAAPYGRLLGGKADAGQEAWSANPEVLPPAQALAAALAMQEVLGGPEARPNWALLEQIPSFTVPLRLMRPMEPTVSPPGQGKPPAVP